MDHGLGEKKEGLNAALSVGHLARESAYLMVCSLALKKDAGKAVLLECHLALCLALRMKKGWFLQKEHEKAP